MEFTKIQLAKQGTLNVTYKNADGDIVDVKGANIVHKDLKDAMNALIPHLSIITEQRESYGRTLKEVQSDRITDEGTNSVYKRMTVDTISLANNERDIAISGQRILTRVGVVLLTTPRIDLENSDDYEYNDDLDLLIEAVKYEAKEYLEQKKWGVKEASIDFKDIDPFNGVTADEVPEAAEVTMENKPKKRGRKPKKTA